MARPGDEGPHAPAPEAASWQESWGFDFADAGGTGGFVRLVQFPDRGTSWYWAYLAGPAFGLVVVRDHEVPLVARPNPLEVRAEALWAELVCEQPLEHWGLAAEAFGLRVEPPGDAERGERIAVGFDLGWEAVAPPVDDEVAARAGDGGYTQSGTVVGELLVGAARFPFTGLGSRTHQWGEQPWWTRTASTTDPAGDSSGDPLVTVAIVCLFVGVVLAIGIMKFLGR